LSAPDIPKFRGLILEFEIPGFTLMFKRMVCLNFPVTELITVSTRKSEYKRETHIPIVESSCPGNHAFLMSYLNN
jgi:hypothetical protein